MPPAASAALPDAGWAGGDDSAGGVDRRSAALVVSSKFAFPRSETRDGQAGRGELGVKGCRAGETRRADQLGRQQRKAVGNR
jgi:hypothetical protein